MPEFIMPIETTDARQSFTSLDAFTQAYVEALFFTDTGYSEDDDLEDATFDDLAPVTLVRIVEDCKAFQEHHAELLERAAERSERFGDEQAGHDYWLTRNRHGAGYWDRGLGSIGSDLTTAAHADGSCDLYRGDDGLLYLA